MINNTFDRFVQVNVDVQNDFCPGGSLAVSEGDTVVPQLNKLSEVIRNTGGQVVYTRDWHPLKTNHFVTDGGPWPVHCVAQTEGAMFHKDLEVHEDDIIISKGTKIDEDAFSGFQGTTISGEKLAEIITPKNNLEKVAVLVGGLATDYCVKATVLDGIAYKKSLANPKQVEILAISDAMKAVNLQPEDGYRALFEMSESGAIIVTSEQALQIIRRNLDNLYSREK